MLIAELQLQDLSESCLPIAHCHISSFGPWLSSTNLLSTILSSVDFVTKKKTIREGQSFESIDLRKFLNR